MNYYEHHIGDYDQATAHLTACEDGIYSRLIRWYMASETPLPADLKAIQRRVRAHSRDERAAVQTVLAEFFELRDGGYHQHRCDEEIARYLETEPEREAKRENDKERQRRSRERRKTLFDALRGHGIVPAWDTKTSDLEAQLSRVTSPPTVTPVTPPVTRDNTATHTPDTTPQSPNTNPETHTGDVEGGNASGARVSMASAVCLALKAKGIGRVNSGRPELLALLDAGAEVQNFVAAVDSAKGKSDPFAYILGVVKGQMDRARAIAAQGRVSNPSAALGSSGSDRRAARMAEAVPGLTTRRPAGGEIIDTEARDVTPERLG